MSSLHRSRLAFRKPVPAYNQFSYRWQMAAGACHFAVDREAEEIAVTGRAPASGPPAIRAILRRKRFARGTPAVQRDRPAEPTASPNSGKPGAGASGTGGPAGATPAVQEKNGSSGRARTYNPSVSARFARGGLTGVICYSLWASIISRRDRTFAGREGSRPVTLYLSRERIPARA